MATTSQIRKIHTLKNFIGLDDDLYREMLMTFGVQSSKNLTDTEVTGQLASSISTYYDDNSAIIGSNLDYAAIHQLGGQAGKSKKTSIPARPYLQVIDFEYIEINKLIKKNLIY